jgi:hypothetical protein
MRVFWFFLQKRTACWLGMTRARTTKPEALLFEKRSKNFHSVAGFPGRPLAWSRHDCPPTAIGSSMEIAPGWLPPR